jgi:hypothetical protein
MLAQGRCIFIANKSKKEQPMSQFQTYTDILLDLPVDDTMKAFIKQHGLQLPKKWVWKDSVEISKRLSEMIQSSSIPYVRERTQAALHNCANLGNEQGRHAMFQAVHGRAEVIARLISCKSDLHRAFWLYVHESQLFEMASEIEFLDHHAHQARQHDLGLKRLVRRDAESITAFEEAISRFYQRELGCGEVCVANVLDRMQGTQLVTIRAKDLPSLVLQYQGDQLHRQIGVPNIHMVLEYAQATGVVRTLIRGGAKYHAMLCAAFAQYLLGVEVDAQSLRAPKLNLAALRRGVVIPQAIEDGVIGLQVKSVTVVSCCGQLMLECVASSPDNLQCVTELLNEFFATENPLLRGWSIQAAILNLHLAPTKDKRRSPVVSVEVTHKGQLNLHRFDESLRGQLESYLVRLGIMREQQVFRPDLCLSA